ncbi:hypothetical protein FOMG_16814 [Fusarium oxysporum f. sp. melonis 26406]|uniref:Uncharacterized protein n=1 Tax=Fusarium oxysporum f. sp. melonis 26406 TaxID=1089452 RepID=X0A024_FUSOX|nr:hypothetical protein FOMG_16814 [Fusarium oxysporum f. sp. melonis 26406]
MAHDEMAFVVIHLLLWALVAGATPPPSVMPLKATAKHAER